MPSIANHHIIAIASHLASRYEQQPDFDQPQWVLSLSGREATRYHRRKLHTAVDEEAGHEEVIEEAAGTFGAS